MWNYKSECARRYDDIVESATSGAELGARFGDEMAATLRDEASLHRLWYDLRNQALFERRVPRHDRRHRRLLEDMVWAVVNRYAELEGRDPSVTSGMAYALFDGMFQNSLIRFMRGDPSAVEDVRAGAPALLRGAL